jgi:transposase
MIRVLRVARRGALKARVAAAEQLHGVRSSAPEELRQPCSASRPSTWSGSVRPCGPGPDSPTAATKTSLRTLATTPGRTRPARPPPRALVPAAALVALPGIGIDTAGQLAVTAGDNPQRLRSEAAFAHLCGAAPIPASSGRSDHHRRNRAGDRRANNPLWRIALVRMHCHPPTRAYVERRTKQGRSKLDILRCLKRYIAREVYPTSPTHHPPPLPLAPK